ncbi:cobalt ABC transporter permease [Mesorhizobium microcysteis]|uniref:Cobalt ABC transporter permease n=1 Tax=Neoaquamicrobium microcysteis TaxID=2682781 RepID=A0A5D4GPA1_9HYPH|nr:cobalt ABC transporter permease [Mesorhizobium microcysteis]
MTALRGIVMILAGIFAFLMPAQAVKFVLLAGGGLLLVDGCLGLASMDFASRRVHAYYLALSRNLLCIAAGAIVLASGFLTGLFTLSFLATVVGLLVILAGLVELVSILMDHERYASPMMAMVGGGLYVVAGLVLIFMPLSSAAVLMRLATILLIAYALSLLYRAWRIRAASPDAG